MAPQQSAAQTLEKFMQRTAIGTFLLAVSYTIGTAEFLVSADLAETLNIIQKPIGLLVILIVAPAVWSLKRIGAIKPRPGCDEPESFVKDMLARASTLAFSITFVVLLALQVLSDKIFTDQPPAFFIGIALMVSLYVFSVSFFVLSRDTGDDDDFGEDRA
ncbi:MULTISPECIES: hypothetical protein [Kordiimonas]|jgi:hypothetical protein|uniref:hypothetical protein n=1 Tax=Kordiimonas TaxID=288021 RepID=UPI00257B1A29|nr:hypothetical protein [Kordiimonas sp. UBA4487]